MEKALIWFKKGSKSVRLLKVGLLTTLFYWSIHFLSTRLKVAEAICALAIYCALIVWARQRRRYVLKVSGIEEFDTMSDDDTYARIRLHLESLGWKVEKNTRTEGLGADFVCIDGGGVRRAVGFAGSAGEEVGPQGVQAVAGALSHYRADKGLVITNGWLNDGARTLAMSNHIEVWDREKFARSLLQGKEP